MKNWVLVLTVFMAFSCQKKETNQASENFDWLTGNWQRTNEDSGKSTFENWKKINDSTYSGHGFTLQNRDTLWQENMTLSPLKSIWYLQVKLPNEEKTTDFKVIFSDQKSFFCENKQNDFPKLIAYKRDGEKLLADISDDENKIEFIFEPK